MDIQKVHKSVLALLGKDESSYFPPNIIDQEIYKETNSIFNKLREEFESTQIISDKLRLFAKTETVTLTDGKGDIKGLHPISVFDSQGNSCNGVRTDAWHIKSKDTVFGPEDDYPVYRVWDNQLWVLPTTKTSVTVEYLSQPVEPFFNFTIDGDKYIFNPTDSVNVEFPDILIDDMVNRVASNLGMQIRQGDMVEYGEIKQAKEI